MGWVAHVGALALVPLSLAQAVIAGGFVVLAVLAERMFGFGLGRRQWGGIALVASGLAFLGATAPLDAQQTRYSLLAIAVFQALLLLFGLLLIVVTHTVAVAEQGPLDDEAARDDEHPRTGGAPQAPVTAHTTSRRPHRMAGILLGTAAGIAFAVSDVSIKALAEAVIAAPSAIISPWTATALIASVGAFYTSARSLQIGDGIAVITATTAAANLATIAGGIVVFGERLGDSTGESFLRLAAFGLVIAGAALMPGPTRAAEAGAQEERRAARAALHARAAHHRAIHAPLSTADQGASSIRPRQPVLAPRARRASSSMRPGHDAALRAAVRSGSVPRARVPQWRGVGTEDSCPGRAACTAHAVVRFRCSP